jgi:hypothetical protein
LIGAPSATHGGSISFLRALVSGTLVALLCSEKWIRGFGAVGPFGPGFCVDHRVLPEHITMQVLFVSGLYRMGKWGRENLYTFATTDFSYPR